MQSIIDKKEELGGKYEETEYKGTKTMYKRNIAILRNYEDFDLKKCRPSKSIELIKKHKDNFVLYKGLHVQVSPHSIFLFEKSGIEKIGAIWFIAKLGGLKKDELGMYTDILYRYLRTHFAKDYNLSSRYCIAVDVVNHSQI